MKMVLKELFLANVTSLQLGMGPSCGWELRDYCYDSRKEKNKNNNNNNNKDLIYKAPHGRNFSGAAGLNVWLNK